MPAYALKEELYEPEIPIWQSKPLPTMYDLPSEDPEEPGLPDDFHYHQPQLLRETFCLPNYSADKIYVASDLNLYYDPQHTHWYKRPDWFAVLGVPPSYGEQHDMRYSYVVWDEKIIPFIVVELLSESTKKDDLGKTLREAKEPPTKWEVYEQILKVPYYVIFSRESDEWQVFQLRGKRYQRLSIKDERFWLPKIRLGLGIWSGIFNGFNYRWLRWFDKDGWIPTPVEAEQKRTDAETQRADTETQRADTETQRADTETQRADTAFENGIGQGKLEMARKMLAKGYSSAEIIELTSLSSTDLAAL